MGSAPTGGPARTRVAVVRSDYEKLEQSLPADRELDRQEIERVVRAAVDELGGMAAFVGPEDRWVVIKPNIVVAGKRGSGEITDAHVVWAVVKLVHEANPAARISIAEGSAGFITPSHPEALDVREVTDGEGVPVVYESIGKTTFAQSLDCLRPMGILASYGHASGAPDPVDVIELGAKGSLFVTRPAIMHYMAKREDMLASAADLFEVVSNGSVEIAVNHVLPLREAAEAHRAIEERRTTGSTVLMPFE